LVQALLEHLREDVAHALEPALEALPRPHLGMRRVETGEGPGRPRLPSRSARCLRGSVFLLDSFGDFGPIGKVAVVAPKRP